MKQNILQFCMQRKAFNIEKKNLESNNNNNNNNICFNQYRYQPEVLRG